MAVELAALTQPAGLQRIQAALGDRWLLVEPLSQTVSRPLPFPLDPGETAAITLACQLKADVLLMDEKRGRQAARHCALVVAGTVEKFILSQVGE